MRRTGKQARTEYKAALAMELSGLESADMIEEIRLWCDRFRMVWDYLGAFAPYDGCLLVVRFRRFGAELIKECLIVLPNRVRKRICIIRRSRGSDGTERKPDVK